MKGIYWRTLTFKKCVIYLIKVNYTSYNYKPCNSTWTCLLSLPPAVRSVKSQKYIPDSYSSNEKVGLGLGCLTFSSSRISSMSSSSGSDVISNQAFINQILFHYFGTVCIVGIMVL
jgi:hypothetical protein